VGSNERERNEEKEEEHVVNRNNHRGGSTILGNMWTWRRGKRKKPTKGNSQE